MLRLKKWPKGTCKEGKNDQRFRRCGRRRYSDTLLKAGTIKRSLPAPCWLPIWLDIDAPLFCLVRAAESGRTSSQSRLAIGSSNQELPRGGDGPHYDLVRRPDDSFCCRVCEPAPA